MWVERIEEVMTPAGSVQWLTLSSLHDRDRKGMRSRVWTVEPMAIRLEARTPADGGSVAKSHSLPAGLDRCSTRIGQARSHPRTLSPLNPLSTNVLFHSGAST